MKPFLFVCVLISSILSFAETPSSAPALKSALKQEAQSKSPAKVRSVLVPRNPKEADRVLKESMGDFQKWLQEERKKAQAEILAESLATLEKEGASTEELKSAYRELIEAYEREVNGPKTLEGVGELPESSFERLSVLDGLVDWSDAVCKVSESLAQVEGLSSGVKTIEDKIQQFLPGEKSTREKVEAYERGVRRVRGIEAAWKDWSEKNPELIDAATKALAAVITFEESVEEGMHRRLAIELIRRGEESAKRFENMWKREADRVRQRWIAERLKVHRTDWERAQKEKAEADDEFESAPYKAPDIEIALEDIDMGFIDTNLLLAQFPTNQRGDFGVDPKSVPVKKFHGGKLKDLVKVFEKIASSKGYAESKRFTGAPLSAYEKALDDAKKAHAPYVAYIEYAREVQAHIKGCQDRIADQVDIAKGLLRNPETTRIEQFVELKTNLEKIEKETEFKPGRPLDETVKRLKDGNYVSKHRKQSTHKK